MKSLSMFNAIMCVMALLLFSFPAKAVTTTTSTSTSIYGVALANTTTKAIASATSQAIPAGGVSTFTKMTFASAVKDARSEISITNSKITVKSDGLYLVGARVRFDAASDNVTREFMVYLNGSDGSVGQCVKSAGANAATVLTANVPLVLSAGDYLELYARQNSAAAVNASAKFWVIKL